MAAPSPKMTPIHIIATVLVSALLSTAASAALHHHHRHHPRHLGRTPRVPIRAQARIPMAQRFLNAHNTIRASYGLKPLVWDESLAQVASAWADKRLNDCEMIHSNYGYGENLFWGLYRWNPTRVVRSWANEKQFYNPKTNKCTPGQMCGHYTQIVWSGTTAVGCAKKKCTGKIGGYFVVCNYNPPGNWMNVSPFDTKFKVPQLPKKVVVRAAAAKRRRINKI